MVCRWVHDAAAMALRRQCQPAIFGETVGIAEVGDVFARGALVGLAAARDGVGPVLVVKRGAARQGFGEVAANMIEIE